MFQVMAAATLAALAQPADAGPKTSDLAWLEGCWIGEGFGADVQECWMSTDGPRMTGMFEMSQDGRQMFSEIFILDEFEDGPAIRLKHFSSDFVGWETKDEYVVFPLLETGDGLARFEGVEYRLHDDGRLVVTMETSHDGETSVDELVFERVSDSD